MYKNRYLLLTLSFAIFFSFFKLGQQPLHVFDEARNGVNAFEMLDSGDWINLRFGGQADEWNLKPPLFIWSVAAAYQLFGYSVWSLRLPVALATILSFLLLFKIINLYQSPKFACYTCLILMSVKGIIGFHVGRTGDFDAMLLCFSLAGIFFFIQSFHFKKTNHLYFSALCFGLAFMSKGWAMALYIPGILLYLFFNSALSSFLKKRTTWLAVLLFLMFPLAWFLCIHFYGINHSGTRGGNAFESMFFYDIISRFTQSGFEGNDTNLQLLGIFPQLDVQYNLWNYFLFLLIGLCIYWLYQTKFKIVLKTYPLILLSICLVAPMLLFFNFTLSQRYWYTAPALPFVAIGTYFLYDKLKAHFPLLKILFFGLLIFTLLRQTYKLNTVKPLPEIFIAQQQLLKDADLIIKPGKTKWNEAYLVLNLLFLNPNVQYDHRKPSNNKPDSEIIFTDEKYLTTAKLEYPDYEVFDGHEGFYVLVRRD